MRAFALGLVVCFGLATPAMAQDEGDDPFADYAAGRYFAAESGAEAALSQDPENPVWWALLAEARARLGRHRDAAAAFGRAADYEGDAGNRSYFLRAMALQLTEAGAKEDARAVLLRAMADAALGSQASLDWAMVAIAVGDDRAAQQILSDETLYAGFTRQTALDAGYSAKRHGMDARAVRFFRAGLALDENDPAPLAPQQRENIRREVRELERNWSFLAQAGYSSAGRPDALVPLGDAEVVQFGAEVSRRLGGWRSGRPFSLFARVFHSQYPGEGATPGHATQGWLGARYKPLASLNLNLEASKLIGLDSRGLDDWSLRAAISAGEGMETETGRNDWTYVHAYGDISYLFDHDVSYGIAEVRYGRAFALGEATSLAPYAVARAGLDTGRVQEGSLGAGAGIALRHWYGGDETTAPRGFIDFDLQARESIVGDDSAGGILATITVGR